MQVQAFFFLHGGGRASWLYIMLDEMQGEEPKLLLPLRNEVPSSRVGIGELPFFSAKATGNTAPVSLSAFLPCAGSPAGGTVPMGGGLHHMQALHGYSSIFP